MYYIEHPLIKPESIEKRDYQINIAKNCLEKSTLVVLPTGMGKTTIALLVIAEKLTRGKILFLAPTKPLVEQHFSYVKNYLVEEKICVLTGEVIPKKRVAFWNSNKIIVSTPQVIENDLITNRIDLNNVALIVFDEAHRAVGNYSYTFIAQKYANLALGMTASPGSNADDILDVCKNLKIGNVEIRSEYDSDVRSYIHDIYTKWVVVELSEDLKSVVKNLREVLEAWIKELRSFGLLKPSGRVSTKELLEAQKHIQGRIKARLPKPPESLFYAATAQACAIKVNHAIELAETQGISALRNYFERLGNDTSRAGKMLINDPKVKSSIMLANQTEVEHHKVKETIKLVEEQMKSKADSRIIVFTHYRDTSELVANELNKISGIRAVRFIGQATKGKDKGLKQKEQAEIIENFKSNRYNVLVATAVGEEGLDIPQTDLVLFYEPIPSEIRTIQRRGRTGRKRPGKVIILMTKGTRDESYYWSSRRKEKKMHMEIQKLKYNLSRKIGFEIEKPEVIYSATQTSTLRDPPKHLRLQSIVEGKKGQVTLADYFSTDKKLTIVVDNREFNSDVVKELSLMNITVVPGNLNVGDYIISEVVGIERKTVEDFIQSMIEGKLFLQVKALKNNYPKPILILEGESLVTTRKVSQNAIFGALASIATDFGMPIIPTKDAKETALLLSLIAKRETEEGRIPRVRGEKGCMSLSERQQFIVESLPNISAVLAQRLLSHFDTVKEIFNADIDDLMKVNGIGKKTAEEIVNLLRAKYRGK